MSFEPFLRWAGGKTWLVPYLDNIIGNTAINHYHEPFLGGGAIFFNINRQRRAYLSDENEELINAYLCVRDQPETVIELIQGYENTADTYYYLRGQTPKENVLRAARFIFLNQTSFNGLYRVNRQGQYNVPYGHRLFWMFDADKIREASLRLRNTSIRSCDFEDNKNKIKQHDLIFLDPPYTVSHNNNAFIKYNRNLFSLTDQHRLSRFIDYIKRKDAYYILTNAAHQTIAEIFEKGDHRLELQRPSLIGGRNARRDPVTEYVFTNLPGVMINDVEN